MNDKSSIALSFILGAIVGAVIMKYADNISKRYYEEEIVSEEIHADEKDMCDEIIHHVDKITKEHISEYEFKNRDSSGIVRYYYYYPSYNIMTDETDCGISKSGFPMDIFTTFGLNSYDEETTYYKDIELFETYYVITRMGEDDRPELESPVFPVFKDEYLYPWVNEETLYYNENDNILYAEDNQTEILSFEDTYGSSIFHCFGELSYDENLVHGYNPFTQTLSHIHLISGE